jgi:hypothetical protein
MIVLSTSRGSLLVIERAMNLRSTAEVLHFLDSLQTSRRLHFLPQYSFIVVVLCRGHKIFVYPCIELMHESDILRVHCNTFVEWRISLHLRFMASTLMAHPLGYLLSSSCVLLPSCGLQLYVGNGDYSSPELKMELLILLARDLQNYHCSSPSYTTQVLNKAPKGLNGSTTLGGESFRSKQVLAYAYLARRLST